MGNLADFDPAASRLRLAGDLRMADTAQLESVLRAAERTRSAELLLKPDGSVQRIRRAETVEDYFATLSFADL